jgi:hypothetical protein
MFQRLTLCSVGDVFCPWRYRMTVSGGNTAIGLVTRVHQPRTSKPGRFKSRDSQSHQTFTRALAKLSTEASDTRFVVSP